MMHQECVTHFTLTQTLPRYAGATGQTNGQDDEPDKSSGHRFWPD